jgi:hypothetical protein
MVMASLFMFDFYKAFHNVLHDYKHYNKKIKGPALTELFTAREKLKKFFY